jgi:cellulose synthase/poly-beta-1,6-N-acetylglucosamine synthase-like glycosyltransferase
MYFAWSTATFRMHVLWGANMAIRRKAWEEIKPEAATHDVQAHEDLDLSILVASHGWRTLQDDKLHIEKEGREYHKWPKFWRYTKLRFKTFHRHHDVGAYTRAGAQFLPRWRSWVLYVSLLLPGAFYVGTSVLFYWIESACAWLKRVTR